MKERKSTSISRREFVRLTASSAAAVAAGGILTSCSGDEGLVEPALTSDLISQGKRGDAVRYPLRIPSVVSPTDLQLAAAPGLADVGGGQMSTVWAYNGEFPGPTIEANRGDRATVRMLNGIGDETIIHWHGMIVGRKDDGHPQDVVLPGEHYDYGYDIDQRACLNWYHPHPDRLTGEQVNMGLAGAFIIRDDVERALNLPSGPYEIPLIIRDADFRKGNLIYRPKKSGFLGKVPLVNGTVNPSLDVAPTVYRFRILNGANARNFRLSLTNGLPLILIGNDGGLLPGPAVSMSEIVISPGERLDVLVDFRGLQNISVMLRDLDERWDLLEFVVADGADIPGTVPPGPLSDDIVPLSEGDVVTTRTFSFEGMSRINGLEYGIDRIDETVPLGQTERWIFTTKGNAPHPVHVHAAPFQVVSRSGGRGMVFPWEEGLKDTVLLEDGETVEVLVRFDAFAGLFLLHCHKLEHEDAGMMSNFEIVAS